MASLILVRNVVGELQPKRTLEASRGFLAAARLSCSNNYNTLIALLTIKHKRFTLVVDWLLCPVFTTQQQLLAKNSEFFIL